jgi:hypothetical protein
MAQTGLDLTMSCESILNIPSTHPFHSATDEGGKNGTKTLLQGTNGVRVVGSINNGTQHWGNTKHVIFLVLFRLGRTAFFSSNEMRT